MVKLMLVMKTLALMLVSWKLTNSPPSAAMTANRMDRPPITSGLAESRCAAAPG